MSWFLNSLHIILNISCGAHIIQMHLEPASATAEVNERFQSKTGKSLSRLQAVILLYQRLKSLSFSSNIPFILTSSWENEKANKHTINEQKETEMLAAGGISHTDYAASYICLFLTSHIAMAFISSHLAIISKSPDWAQTLNYLVIMKQC